MKHTKYIVELTDGTMLKSQMFPYNKNVVGKEIESALKAHDSQWFSFTQEDESLVFIQKNMVKGILVIEEE